MSDLPPSIPTSWTDPDPIHHSHVDRSLSQPEEKSPDDKAEKDLPAGRQDDLIDLKVHNPVNSILKRIEKFFKNQDISMHFRIKPFAAIGLLMTFGVAGSGGFTLGKYIFPNSSNTTNALLTPF